MSVQYIGAVLDCRDENLSTSRRMILVVLANFAGDDGHSWPSQELIAEQSGCKIRSAREHLKWLTDNGFITRHTKNLGQGRGSRTSYKIHRKRLEQITTDKPGHAGAEFAPAKFAAANNGTCTGRKPQLTNRQEPSITPNGVSAQNAPTPPKAKKRKVTKRGSRMSEAWAPTPTDYAHASKNGLTSQEINHEADQFRDYHVAKGTISKDWSASWRTWCRNTVKWKSERKQQRARPGRHEAVASVFDQVADQFDYGAVQGRDGEELYPAHTQAGHSSAGGQATLIDADGSQLTWDGGTGERAA
ncbi:MAG: helix-turn-helix domain-containing protein [Alteromonas sp.]|nr:helix-turn-helix domain-containing protein [Alteromonas sp.]